MERRTRAASRTDRTSPASLRRRGAGGQEPARRERRPARRAIRNGPARAILLAATREFAAEGFGGARVDAIADRAQINKRMLYHYFGNKEELYLAVLEEAYRGIRTAERKLHLEDLSPDEGIRKLVAFTWDYFLNARAPAPAYAPSHSHGYGSSNGRRWSAGVLAEGRSQITSPRCRRGFAAGHQFGDIITPATLSVLITLPQRGTPR